MKPIDSLSDAELMQRVRRALDELPDAPAALQQAAIDLWPAAPAQAFTLDTRVRAAARRIAAVLSFDNWTTPAFAHGMRSLAPPPRHLVFSAIDRDVDLRITPAPDGFVLCGQLLGPDDSGLAELAPQGAPDAEVRRTALDAFGEFRLDRLPAGAFVLTLSVGQDQIVLPPIEVGDCSS